MQFEFYKNILAVNNYRQIKQLDNDLIALEKLKIHGTNLHVLKLDKEVIIVEGVIQKIELGDA
ncbi:MAG: YabP/YqfC family sporulation protein [Anaeroplasmataceae bacterium]|nr:YabP/YqfC family sporulation protein [Anaeroplasmataceae bacterium]